MRRHPYRSAKGPIMRRMIIVPDTERMFEMRICDLFNSRPPQPAPRSRGKHRLHTGSFANGFLTSKPPARRWSGP